METYEQNLHISDSAFECMRNDTDRVMQKLLKNMIEKESMEGKVTITIDLTLIPEFIPNYDPEIEGETRRVLKPTFSHKVGSVMQIKNEAKGGTTYENMELVWDDDLKEYVMKPICNTQQRSIFDADFKECYEGEVVYPDDAPIEEVPAIEGSALAALPGPSDEDAEDISNEIFEDYDYEEPEGE